MRPRILKIDILYVMMARQAWLEICSSIYDGSPAVNVDELKICPGTALASVLAIATGQSNLVSNNAFWHYSLRLSSIETQEIMEMTIFPSKYEDDRCQTFLVPIIANGFRFDLTLFIAK